MSTPPPHIDPRTAFDRVAADLSGIVLGQYGPIAMPLIMVALAIRDLADAVRETRSTQ